MVFHHTALQCTFHCARVDEIHSNVNELRRTLRIPPSFFFEGGPRFVAFSR